MNNAQGKQHRDQKTPEIPMAEWVVAALGALVVVGSFVFVIWEAATRGNGPPEITLRVDTIVAAPANFVVQIQASNAGDHTAADLHVEGVLLQGDSALERSTASIDYVPPQSTRGGGLIFQKDPRRYTLRLRTTGYQNP